MRYEDNIKAVLAALNPASTAGQFMESVVELSRHRTRGYHAEHCSEISGYGFDPEPVVIGQAILTSEYYCEFCNGSVDKGTGIIRAVVELAERLDDTLLPSQVAEQRQWGREVLVGDLEPLLDVAEKAWSASEAFHAEVVPHAFEILDLLVTLEAFNDLHGRKTFPDEVTVSHLALAPKEARAAGLSSFLVRAAEHAAPAYWKDVSQPTATGAARSATVEALDFHRTRQRLPGEVLVAAPNGASLGPHLRSDTTYGHAAHAREALALPGCADVGVFPADLVPVVVGGPRTLPVSVLDAEGVTPEVLETFLVLRSARPDAEALAAAKALADGS